MNYTPTPEQIEGHNQLVKERQERCKRILREWEYKKQNKYSNLGIKRKKK